MKFKSIIVLLIFNLIVISEGKAQAWEEMAEFTNTVQSRTDSTTLIWNDSLVVEIRDYGINRFTLFMDSTKSYNRFIYTCNCKNDEPMIIGGISRGIDFYRSVDIEWNGTQYTASTFETLIALSVSWSTLDNWSSRRKRKRCMMKQ